MFLPDYSKSIVNLMAMVEAKYGARPLYAPLEFQLKRKNTLLILVDGLGYDWLTSYGKGSFLARNIKARLTSVFPATTAAALTSIYTGVAPQQHGLTGWYVYLKELGVTSTIIRNKPRFGGSGFGDNMRAIMGASSLASRLKAQCHTITAHADSEYTMATNDGADLHSYSNIGGFFRQVNAVAKLNSSRKFIHAYWPSLDGMMHGYGVESAKVRSHFREIDEQIEMLVHKLRDINVIVTADHGLISVPKQRMVWMEDHPILNDCLSMPLSGDSRAAYCFVHPAKAKEFEAYVMQRLFKSCQLFRSEDLLARGWFGMHKPSRRLKDRIGDYVLVMKDDYAIRDVLPVEEKPSMIGCHGGVSSQEMLVPLIMAEC